MDKKTEKYYKKLVNLNESNQKEKLKKENELKKFYDKIDTTEKIVKFVEAYKELKPQILFNYGRDKKYVYGQMYSFESPFSTKKKSFRFMIGKMSDELSRDELNKKCMDIFYDKYINGWLDGTRDKS